MAALKLLFSSARRHCLSKPHSHLHPPPFLRSLTSESDQNQHPSPEPFKRQPVSIETVSYAPKPKEDSSPEPELDSTPQSAQTQLPPLPPPRRPRDSPDSPGPETRSAWTREDARFVKEGPSIAPVSYASRVAPLPEDKVSEEAGDEREEELEKEKQTIEAESLSKRRVFRVEEDVAVPFPTFLKVEKKERKPILDLMEAIRQVKVSVWFSENCGEQMAFT